MRARLPSFSSEERNIGRALADRARAWRLGGGGAISRSTFGRGVGVGVGTVILRIQKDQHKATYKLGRAGRVAIGNARALGCEHDRGDRCVWDGQRNDQVRGGPERTARATR